MRPMRPRSVLLLLFLVPAQLAAAAACDSTCQAAQQASLQQLYGALGGPEWSRQQGWATAAPDYCTWQGVRCCSSNGLMARSTIPCPVTDAVAGLDLAGNKLAGPWPAAALSGLSESLVHLDVRGNQLTGSIPSSISGLASISRLYVDENSLTGPLPAALGQLGNLTEFSAAANRFSGGVPASLTDLQQLQWLLLDRNQLTGGVDAGLLQLPQLEVLDLQDNQLSGALPPIAVTGQQQQQCVLTGRHGMLGQWLVQHPNGLDISLPCHHGCH